ncbi:HNH endonuclease [Erwinia phage phiEa1H]|uniref:HNH DNAse n=2 Tax=Eracentumvirus era103 TaxID=1985737 RepID=E5AGH3_9CAUD|nr:G+ HNH endonucleases-like protein [Erwinia phage Era103]YP_007237535.1 HNH DNAse [Erwinia phage phiEa100]ABM63402.1 G+ HNH endonucleases-like protein [Erwinia phage Era103]CBX44472.1 HNH endonuclease [Erwinia phage phiEa1H]CBX45075.1 HNH DNAse [Erwinia phage phiEa100]
MENIEAIELSGYSINKNLTITNKAGAVMRFQEASGYPTVGLTVLGERKRFLVHRLFASKFVPNPGNHPVVNHIDYDTFNFNPSNLEWTTIKSNVEHSKANIIAALCKVKLVLMDAEGGLHKIYNLREWCKTNNYPYSSLAMLSNGHRKQWKGWTLVSKSHT